MWPWEHIAFGYISYSTFSHATQRESPGEWATVIVVFGSLFPDIVDKPLAWGLGILPAGRTLTHSLLVAIPIIIIIYAVDWKLDRGYIASPFAIGYVGHLMGDVLYPLIVKREFRGGFLFWPLRPADSDNGSAQDLLPHVIEVFRDFASFLATTPGLIYIYVEVLILALVTLVWILDGAPGLGLLK